MSEKVDVQYSIFNGVGDGTGNWDNVEKLMLDLRGILIKHNVKFLRSECIEVNEDDILVVRNSEFVGKKRVGTNVENRQDIKTNIQYGKSCNNIFEVEITIKKNKFVRVKVTNMKTGQERVRVPQHFEGDWETHARKVADEMVAEWKNEERIKETKVITYTID